MVVYGVIVKRTYSPKTTVVYLFVIAILLLITNHYPMSTVGL